MYIYILFTSYGTVYKGFRKPCFSKVFVRLTCLQWWAQAGQLGGPILVKSPQNGSKCIQRIATKKQLIAQFFSTESINITKGFLATRTRLSRALAANRRMQVAFFYRKLSLTEA